MDLVIARSGVVRAVYTETIDLIALWRLPMPDRPPVT